MMPAATAAIGIITADSRSLTPDFLERIGIPYGPDLLFAGLETCPEFFSAVIQEKGSLDDDLIRQEVGRAALALARPENRLGAILLECSVLPPYAAHVNKLTNLPVFDYITMINYMFSAVVPRTYDGFM